MVFAFVTNSSKTTTHILQKQIAFVTKPSIQTIIYPARLRWDMSEQHDAHVKAWIKNAEDIMAQQWLDEVYERQHRTPEQIKEDERIDAMEAAADAALDRHMQMAEDRHFEIISGDLDPQEPEWY